jgi:glycine cleavage system H protein
MSDYPAELKYTKDHEWAKIEGDLVRVGITAYAVEQLGDVTLVDLPEVGTTLESAGPFGDIESVKAVSELLAPLSGEVVEINEALADQPELVNEAPYEGGWMVVLRPSDTGQLDALMDAAAYAEFLGTLDG